MTKGGEAGCIFAMGTDEVRSQRSTDNGQRTTEEATPVNRQQTTDNSQQTTDNGRPSLPP